MTIIVILAVLAIAVGAVLVYRNNRNKVESAISKAQSVATDVKKVVADIKK